jgi:pimeloyl-ACP methyl ester carboxylesterase
LVTPTHFTIEVPDSDIEDMKRRIRDTRWPDDPANDDWHYGVERGWLESFAAYWADEYDWRTHEAAINRLPHFTADIDGFTIHFIHLKGKGSNAKPLILTHGWPWTFWDWKEMIGPLTDPAAHGGDPDNSYDIVVPSLPGYGFSKPLAQTGVTVRRVAQLWVELMCNVLGYESFGAVGGDWGAMVTAELGHAFPDRLIGVHIGMPMIPGFDPSQLTDDDFGPDEQWMRERRSEAGKLIASHLTVHTHEPQTLAYGLSDSPVGLAAWLLTRRRLWADYAGDPVDQFGRDFLCTTASIYWLTNTIGSSMRLYMDHFSSEWSVLSQGTKTITVPTAFAIAPKELVMMPRTVAEAQTNLKRWEIFAQGGHFGPAEQPEQLLASVAGFFAEL